MTQLFELDVRYVVPLYQRSYVWDEDDQWEPLWDDVVTLVEHQESSNGQQFSHFLGAVVLDQTTSIPGKIPVFTVIDGQQRLTTLQIFLTAAANVAKDHGASDEGEIMRDLVRNNEKKASGIELFKVWPTNRDRSAFEAVMASGGPPDDRIDDPNNRIDEAYKYFRSRVEEWILASDEEARASRLELLRITLCDLLKIVSITLEADDNAQVIFETLNARGTPLLALDLVKNAVFLEAARQELDTESLYHAVWQPELDDEYWRELKRQGRLNRPRGELFLMHWLTMKLRRLVPATELFSTFREHVLGAKPPPQIAELVPELCRDAATMRGFDSQPAGSVEQTFFQRLEILDTSTVLPLVLFLYRESGVSPERRRRALQIIESWLVRRMLMGLTAKNYNQQIPVIVGRVASEPARADEIILEELQTGIGEISRWPDDDELREQLAHRGMYGYVSQPRLAMVLAALEESLYSSKVERLPVPSKLSIEHVLPQKWRTHWPLPADLLGEELLAAEADRDAHIHLLGNLTLTTVPLNAALSNEAWSKKQQELNRESKLLLNTRLIEKYGEEFNEAAIDQRGAELADRIIEMWPGPSSPRWIADEFDLVAPAADLARKDQAVRSDESPATVTALHRDGEPESLRAAVREQLSAGLTPDQVHRALGDRRDVWFLALEEEARAEGALNAVEPTPENVAALRDGQSLRWERIATRVFGDPRATAKVKSLYDEARGIGASRRSYTGRGRRFGDMEREASNDRQEDLAKLESRESAVDQPRSDSAEHASWTEVARLSGQTYSWPDPNGGVEHYDPFVVYESDDGLRLAVGRLSNAREREMNWVFKMRNDLSLKRPLTPFVAADDFGETGEMLSLIRGKGPKGRQMFGPGDDLPAAYKTLRLDVHAERKSGGYHKYCVVAHKDDAVTMLEHCAAQVRLRGI